jgi:hypothetical protein
MVDRVSTTRIESFSSRAEYLGHATRADQVGDRRQQDGAGLAGEDRSISWP